MHRKVLEECRVEGGGCVGQDDETNNSFLLYLYESLFFHYDCIIFII